MVYLIIDNSRRFPPLKERGVYLDPPGLTFFGKPVMMPVGDKVAGPPTGNGVKLHAKQPGDIVSAAKSLNQIGHVRNHVSTYIPTNLGLQEDRSPWMRPGADWVKLCCMDPARQRPAIAERLELVRIRLSDGLNQTDFAVSLGIGVNRYNNYENAKSQPRLDAAQAIVDIYGVTLDYIYTGKRDGLPLHIDRQLYPPQRAA